MVVNAPGPVPQTPGQAMGGPFDTYFLEADKITGPFRLITYWPAFGPAAYFANIVSRFTATAVTKDEDGNDVVEAYLSYSQCEWLHASCRQSFRPFPVTGMLAY